MCWAKLSVAIGLAWLVGVPCDFAHAAELVTEVIRLRYRNAEQVLSLVRSMVPKPGTVDGTDHDLVVRTTRANMSEVRTALAALDRAPKRILITVRQDASAEADRQSAGMSGTARRYGTRSADRDRAVQRVQVSDGGEAVLYVGRSVPVVLRGTRETVRGGRIVDDGRDQVVFRDVLSGFVVRPQVDGGHVRLDISSRDDASSADGPGGMEVRRVSTSLSGRLGEWIEVGAVLPGDPATNGSTIWSTRSAGGSARRILVKVEVLD